MARARFAERGRSVNLGEVTHELQFGSICSGVKPVIVARPIRLGLSRPATAKLSFSFMESAVMPKLTAATLSGWDSDIARWRSIWFGMGSRQSLLIGKQIPTFAAQIVDLLDSLGIDKAHIEGESLGGWVALWMALHHPDRVDKMILNTTAGIHFDHGAVQERPAEGRQLLRQRSMEAIQNPNRETIRKRLEWLMASPDRVTDELVEVRYRMYADPETRRALTDVFNNSFGDGDSV